MNVTGQRGVAKVGHHRAAEFVRWTLSSMIVEAVNEPAAFTIIGTVTYTDVFWVTHSQFSIGLYMGTREGEESWWVWDNIRMSIFQGTASFVVIGKPSIRAVF